MKILAYYPLHYGAQYLEASIKSIADAVDKIIILYTPKPSFGFTTNEVCPETESQLKDIALSASSKVDWVPITAGQEYAHRELAMHYAIVSKYDILLAVDSDEVWDPRTIGETLRQAIEGEAWRYNIEGFVHFWKSFDYCNIDGFRPARIFNLNRTNHDEKEVHGDIYHFGYCQSETIMNYKMKIHGHHDEIRPNWKTEIFDKWKPDAGIEWLHPTSLQIWHHAEIYDKIKLPDILKQHPDYNKPNYNK